MKKSLGAEVIVFPTPVWCVGSYDDNEKPNVMTVAWGGVCCSKPPCITISLRKATYTYDCILKREAFTVSVPSEKYVKEVDFFGIASGRDVDKFVKTGLTPVKSEVVDAPYVKEFAMILECRLIHHHDLGLHTQFVGEVMDCKVEEDMLNSEGEPDIKKIQPFVFTPWVCNYYNIGNFIGRAFKIWKDL